MKSIAHPPTVMERSEFIESLNDEFTSKQGFGIYAFLSFSEIDDLYHLAIVSTEAPKVAIKMFVKHYLA